MSVSPVQRNLTAPTLGDITMPPFTQPPTPQAPPFSGDSPAPGVKPNASGSAGGPNPTPGPSAGEQTTRVPDGSQVMPGYAPGESNHPHRPGTDNLVYFSNTQLKTRSEELASELQKGKDDFDKAAAGGASQDKLLGLRQKNRQNDHRLASTYNEMVFRGLSIPAGAPTTSPYDENGDPYPAPPH
jgi:hypothetical protein